MATPMHHDGLQQMMAQLRQMSGQSLVPSESHLSFIPENLRSNVLLMSAQPLRQESMTTIFLGTLGQNYVDEMWKIDVDNWQKNLNHQPFIEVKMLPSMDHATGTVTDSLNSVDSIPKIENALKTLNASPHGGNLRVVFLGTAFSAFVYDALTYLLKEWKGPTGSGRISKSLQFITSGDSGKKDLCNFCEWLCVAGICDTVEFYNTKNYHPFGYCNLKYPTND